MCLDLHKDEMREELMKDNLHEEKMRTDIEYFCEYTVENLYFNKPIHLFDVMIELKKECVKYEQDIQDVFDYARELI